MSEENKAEPQEKSPASKLQSDYSNLSFKAGNIQYQVHCLKNDLRLINEEMLKVTLEYNKAKDSEKPSASEGESK